MATYTTYKTRFTLDNRKPKTPQYIMVDVGEGFETEIRNTEVMDKYDLLGKDVLTFVNEICTLVDTKKPELPADDWDALALALKVLMIRYDGGELYYYLLHTYGADALNYHAWVHFAEDTDWLVCVNTFANMPTEFLEEYAAKRWASRATTAGESGKKQIIKAISERTDIYGINSLPMNMVEGILFS
jgi:hypothetical protein